MIEPERREQVFVEAAAARASTEDYVDDDGRCQWTTRQRAISTKTLPPSPKLRLSLAKIPSRLKTLGFQDISRNPLPHDLLANSPAASSPARPEIPPQLAPGEPGSAPPTAGSAP
jgi:hypothetical protein